MRVSDLFADHKSIIGMIKLVPLPRRLRVGGDLAAICRSSTIALEADLPSAQLEDGRIRGRAGIPADR